MVSFDDWIRDDIGYHLNILINYFGSTIRFLYQLFGRNALIETSLLEDRPNSQVLPYLPAIRLAWNPLPGNF